jgi:hypothetical protein
MTINKAQGQSLDRVGIFLNHPVFAHGQAFTAVSRVRDPRNLWIYIPNGSNNTANVVIRKAFLQIPLGGTEADSPEAGAGEEGVSTV